MADGDGGAAQASLGTGERATGGKNFAACAEEGCLALRFLPTRSQPQPLAETDTYHWSKYGEKLLKDRQTVRSYFRCSAKADTGCQAKKTVDVVKGGLERSTSYSQQHNHLAPCAQVPPAFPIPKPSQQQQMDNGVQLLAQDLILGGAGENTAGALAFLPVATGLTAAAQEQPATQPAFPRWEVTDSPARPSELEPLPISSLHLTADPARLGAFQATPTGDRPSEDLLRAAATGSRVLGPVDHDGRSLPGSSARRRRRQHGLVAGTCVNMNKPDSDAPLWLKYGEKRLRDNRTIRSYFRCSFKDTTGCEAKKIVDLLGDSNVLPAARYRQEHNHPALASSRSIEVPPYHFGGSLTPTLPTHPGTPAAASVGMHAVSAKPIPVQGLIARPQGWERALLPRKMELGLEHPPVKCASLLSVSPSPSACSSSLPPASWKGHYSNSESLRHVRPKGVKSWREEPSLLTEEGEDSNSGGIPQPGPEVPVLDITGEEEGVTSSNSAFGLRELACRGCCHDGHALRCTWLSLAVQAGSRCGCFSS